ncbi:hypothetical protein Pmar_PMAR019654 [Perkinsus marinus ATCC 50983]|uniref:Uncharacterized protein n=1 Tax=Perkinsus marinus (strain ATCC 50983 / TXsc) TaxID=423536 RepID=C5LFA5_PERM5|nr:hypothetical protein Pmar_PMAR019654 [Perkinsus marinus ATCC 50983]EER04620.1 hypothetical protein Pmar_PMAR019654 [Perkinsus marinus ATCC 50983]|eukprot:XP_002772804.1 hypothetical protein Pmar_PMAR019654 [Perkinsus marinus ATCC 50983]
MGEEQIPTTDATVCAEQEGAGPVDGPRRAGHWQLDVGEDRMGLQGQDQGGAESRPKTRANGSSRRQGGDQTKPMGVAEVRCAAKSPTLAASSQGEYLSKALYGTWSGSSSSMDGGIDAFLEEVHELRRLNEDLLRHYDQRYRDHQATMRPVQSSDPQLWGVGLLTDVSCAGSTRPGSIGLVASPRTLESEVVRASRASEGWTELQRTPRLMGVGSPRMSSVDSRGSSPRKGEATVEVVRVRKKAGRLRATRDDTTSRPAQRVGVEGNPVAGRIPVLGHRYLKSGDIIGVPLGGPGGLGARSVLYAAVGGPGVGQGHRARCYIPS